jgi:RND family efflux transporter MFP subunit
VEGFTEPWQEVAVASPETGIIIKIAVQEGDRVEAGQTLVELDRDVHEATLRIAAQAKDACGALDFARAEVELKKTRLAKLKALRDEGHARQEEVERTAADLAMAEARLRSAQEDHLIRELEHGRALVQLERRKVRAPIDGVVSQVIKELGEFVAPNDPHILTLVQLDPLEATFPVPGEDATELRDGQRVRLRFFAPEQIVEGVIEVVSPLNDAESGTTRIRVRVPNPEGALRSGQRCALLLPDVGAGK